MFARGWACLHTAHLPVPKNLAAKPCVSISSKLIENKRLQVLYFGHLRKTGGRGSYRLVQAGGWRTKLGGLPLGFHTGAAPKLVLAHYFIKGAPLAVALYNLQEACASTSNQRKMRLECAVSVLSPGHP